MNIEPANFQMFYVQPYIPKVSKVKVEAAGHTITLSVYGEHGHLLNRRVVNVQDAIPAPTSREDVDAALAVDPYFGS